MTDSGLLGILRLVGMGSKAIKLFLYKKQYSDKGHVYCRLSNNSLAARQETFVVIFKDFHWSSDCGCLGGLFELRFDGFKDR